MAAATPESFTKLETALLNSSGDVPLHARFRSLFTLKALPGRQSIDIISKGFKDESALLKHELAYVLGQMGDPYAIPTLSNVLSNESEDPMVRHEAAEALGALSAESAIPLLEKYLTCPERAVRETCEIALDKIKWDATPEGKAANQLAKEKKVQGIAQFTSVDPAPAVAHSKLVSSRDTVSLGPNAVNELRDLLLDTSKPLFERYRAMFALRDIGTAEAVDALAAGLNDSSALFKHEVAFVFGQLLSPHSVPALVKTLEDNNEDEMVRHEAAEALGGIATPEVLPVLLLLSDIPDGQLVKKGSPENVVRITANAQAEIGGDLFTEIGTTGEVAVRAHTSWTITPRNRAAILTVTDAYSYYLEVGTIFPKLRTLRKLEGKAVVTEALHCPAYAMLLTDKGVGGKASLSLHTGLSETGVVLATGGAAGWHYNSESGLWRTACGYRRTLEEPDAIFTPLYRLKKISRGWPRYRGAPEPGLSLEEPVSEDYSLPWDELDEDGEEIYQILQYDIMPVAYHLVLACAALKLYGSENATMGVSSKKYVDLIFKASGKYGNWDPPHTVEVGDWGRVDRETGNFVKEGNIFKDSECSALLSDAPDAPLFKKGGLEDVLRVTSGAQMEFKNDLYTEVGGMGELGVRVSGAWEFTPRNRAAVLTATDAYSIYLEVGVVFPRLRKLRKLEGKAIVTEALHCPAYALLLTEKGKGGKASLTLHTGLSDIPVSAGVGAKAGWKFTTESGFWRAACGYGATLDGSDAVYTPLYKLEKVSKGWRVGYRGGTAASSAPMEELVREDYNPPWDDLDEDGDEIPPADSPTSPDF
ncbi:unnamed protein product [Rhizoctonia solani]|nr:unnamed protein product [Rhizoctonia solani]